MENRKLKICIIGSGNVATHLSMALSEKCDILQIFSHKIANARQLANKISPTCAATDSAKGLADADVYIISVKDDAIKSFLGNVPNSKKEALWVHTSGSSAREVFDKSFKQNGVLYPLQTFSKDVSLKMDEISFFIEGSDINATNKIHKLANFISQHVYYANSELRKEIHIAAVFACNFTNFMYTISSEILERHDIPFSVLIPLIKETTRKITVTSPFLSQTGPARRSDKKIIANHLAMLNGDNKAIYELLSNAIIEKYKQ